MKHVTTFYYRKMVCLGMLIYENSIQVLKHLIFLFALPDWKVAVEMYYLIYIFFTMYITVWDIFVFEYTFIL